MVPASDRPSARVLGEDEADMTVLDVERESRIDLRVLSASEPSPSPEPSPESSSSPG